MIHLHTHTAYGSFLDSTNTPKSIVSKAKELKMQTVAITEHGYTCSIIDFYKECKSQGIKPILGCELYVCDDMKNKENDKRYNHLIVLAKNMAGYKNILKLSSVGFTEGFYYKPRVDMKTLQQYSNGIIALSACLGGEIPQMILCNVKYEKILHKAKEYAEIFTDFYLEIQSADNPEQEKVNRTLERLSLDTEIPLVVTSDVHFLEKEDFKLHGIFIQINKERSNEVYKDCWFKTENEVLDVLVKHLSFENAVEAVANTHKIADMCNVELELGKSCLPDFPVPVPYKNEAEYLWELIRQGYKNRGINKLPKEEQKKYQDRLRYEYKIIKQKGYAGYFLITKDFIDMCHDNGILTGDGRGSADNCLVCYIIGITNVDSILYDLNFSRFLTLERKALPDIDNDVPSSKKKEVIELLKKRWGDNKVAQICTFTTLQAKAVIDTVGKVLGLSYAATTEIKKHIPDQTLLLEALEKSSKLKEYQNEYPELFEYATKLEGLPRGISVHAGGVVIVPSENQMQDFCGIALSKNDEIITQLEMHNVEEVGLVKMDLLGVTVLDIISDTLKHIGKGTDFIDVSVLDFQDNKTFELLQNGNTDGVFQLESSGMKDTCIKVKPETMEDVIAILALYRPDTMRELGSFIKRKSGNEAVTFLHNDLESILYKTYGTMIYQEQLMEISKVFAGYSDGEADDLRKGLGKKDKQLVREQAEKFRIMAIQSQYPENVCNDLADILYSMGGYLFNKGHASGYGITTYKTAFLKANYPVEFMTALISNQRKASGATDYESVGVYVMKCKTMGIEVKNPDINLSQPDFIPKGSSILFGFNLIKGIGQNTIEELINKRPYNSFDDFLSKTKESGTINKTAVIALIKSGALDCIGDGRKELLLKYADYRYQNGLDTLKPLSTINKSHVAELTKIKAIKPDETADKDLCLKVMNNIRAIRHKKEWETEVMQGDEFAWEFQTLSYHIKGSPFAGYTLPEWDSYEDGSETLKFFGTVVSVKKTKIKNGKQKGKTMAFVEFSTPEGIREGICFSECWERINDRLEKGDALVVRGKKQGDKCVVNGAMTFDKWITNHCIA